MTKVQEDLLALWLEGHIDDEDAQLLIKNFNPENLKFNLDLLNMFTLDNVSVEDNWNSFQAIKNNTQVANKS